MKTKITRRDLQNAAEGNPDSKILQSLERRMSIIVHNASKLTQEENNKFQDLYIGGHMDKLKVYSISLIEKYNFKYPKQS